jgi:predicted ATP-dependent serine protease
MTKGDQIKDWIITNKPIDKKVAYSQFITATKLDVSQVRFNFIWKEVFEGSETLTTTPVITILTPVEVKLTEIKSIKYPDSVLIPIKSGTPMDTLVSTDGGTMPATITVAPGTSGVGKTTVLLEYMGQVKKANQKKRCLFISSEMNRLHLYKYSKRIDFQGVEILLLGDYKENPTSAIEQIFKQGWDIILIDSIQDTVNKIVATGSMKTTQAENWLLTEMDKTREAKNDLGLYTAFFCTNHMTKGDDYAGSANLKHMTDAMVLFRHDALGEPFIEYVKNRDGQKGKKLYFKISEQGVTFNAERFKRDELALQEIGKVREATGLKNDEWETFFNTEKKN